jgi:hypothetical protein
MDGRKLSVGDWDDRVGAILIEGEWLGSILSEGLLLGFGDWDGSSLGSALSVGTDEGAKLIVG